MCSEDDADELGVEPEITLSAPAHSTFASEPLASAEPSLPPSPDHYPKGNEPDIELMNRLSEALSVLPRNMQELIVERLVSAIMNTVSMDKAFGVATPPKTAPTTNLVPNEKPMPAKVSPSLLIDVNSNIETTPDALIGMPLAAATLAALLSHYSSQVKAQNDLQKTIPVIPVHA